MPLPSHVFRRPFGAAALVYLLAAAPAWADPVRVTLTEPATAIRAGEVYLLDPKVLHARRDHGVDWAVTERQQEAGEAQGVSIRPRKDGLYELVVRATEARALEVRATSREDPGAYAHIKIRVEPAAGAAAAGGEHKAGAGDTKATLGFGHAAHDIHALEDHTCLWETPFSRNLDRPPYRINGLILDPHAASPTLVAVRSKLLGYGAQVIRIDLRGNITPVTPEVPEGYAGPKDEQPWEPALDTRLAIGPDGDILICDPRQHRILRVSPKGEMSTLRDAHRPLRVEAPSGVAVTGQGEVVYSDRDTHRVYLLDQAKQVHVLAGGGNAPWHYRPTNDLAIDYPATACKLAHPSDVTVVSDGRILLRDDNFGVLAVHRDRTIHQIGPIQTVLSELCTSPGEDVFVTSLKNSVYRLRADRGLDQVFVPAMYHPGNSPFGVPVDPRKPGNVDLGIRSDYYLHLGPAMPGGGFLLVENGHRILMVGPAPREGRGASDESLGRRVLEGAAAALDGHWTKANRIRDSLRRFAWNSKAHGLPPDPLQSAAKTESGDLMALPKGVRRLVGSYVTADPKGLSFRAWVALYMMDKLVRAQSPAAAFRLGAFSEIRPAAGSAGGGAGAGTAPGPGDAKVGGEETKATR